MLIPIRHENMSARRWPVITIGLIVINTVVFLATYSSMQEQAPELGQTKAHILLLAAAHPELKRHRRHKNWSTISANNIQPIGKHSRVPITMSLMPGTPRCVSWTTLSGFSRKWIP